MISFSSVIWGQENKSFCFEKLRTARYFKKQTKEELETPGALQGMVLEKRVETSHHYNKIKAQERYFLNKSVTVPASCEIVNIN